MSDPAPKPAGVVLLRHAEKEYDNMKAPKGTDSPGLDPGIVRDPAAMLDARVHATVEMIKTCAAMFGGRVKVFTSPMLRCRETAEAIAAEIPDCPVEVWPRAGEYLYHQKGVIDNLGLPALMSPETISHEIPLDKGYSSMARRARGVERKALRVSRESECLVVVVSHSVVIQSNRGESQRRLKLPPVGGYFITDTSLVPWDPLSPGT